MAKRPDQSRLKVQEVTTHFATKLGNYTRTVFDKGAVRLSTGHLDAPAYIGPIALGSLGEPWMSYSELRSDHGQSVMYAAVEAFAPPEFAAKSRDEKLSDIRGAYPEFYWQHFCHKLEMLEGYSGDAYVTMAWAEQFADKFGSFWLAANAQYAYLVEQDDYAFGYLVAMLDQKKHGELDLERGRKTLAAASQGGESRARVRGPSSAAVLAAMAPYVNERNFSVARAASIVADRGIGTSAEANRKLWNRHSPRK